MRRLIACVLLAGSLTSCAATTTGSSSASRRSSVDATTRAACRHFRNVAGDYASGILTLSELRSKLTEVNNDARFSERTGIASNSRAMLAAITAGDLDRVATAVEGFSDSCAALGL